MSMTAGVRGHLRLRTLAAPLACLILGSALAPGARAAPSAERQVDNSATSASWGAVAVLAGAAPGTGPLAVNWQSLGNKQYVIVDLASTGTLDLTGATLTVSTTRNQAQGTAPFPTISLDACIGASWVDVANTCPGTVQSIGATTGGSLALAASLPSGGRLSVRMSSSGSNGPTSRFTTSLGVDVVRGQVRPPVTVSS